MLEHAFVKKLPAFVMMRGQETYTYSKQDSGFDEKQSVHSGTHL
jgi:hypothetical protein